MAGCRWYVRQGEIVVSINLGESGDKAAVANPDWHGALMKRQVP